MRHTLLFATLALVAMLLAATPAASAQVMHPSITVRLDMPDEPVVQGDAIVIRGQVEYIAESTAQLSTYGVPVQLSVSHSPEWAIVSLSPSSLILTLDQRPSTATRGTATFTALVIAHPDAPIHTLAPLTIEATSAPTLTHQSARGGGTVPLYALAAPDPCAAGTLAAQGAGVTPFTASGGGAVYALLALAGAGIALVAARRARLAGGSTVLVVLAALLAFTPGAAASPGNSAATMALQPAVDAFEPGVQDQIRGKIEVVADATAHAELSGLRVHYSIKSAPEWAMVTLSPQSDVLTFDWRPGLTQRATGLFELTVIPSAHIQESLVGLVEVVAYVDGQLHATAVAASVPIMVHVPPACDELLAAEAALPLEPADAEPQEADDVSVQSATPTTGAGIPLAPVLAGCALAGALVGLAVSRKLR